MFQYPEYYHIGSGLGVATESLVSFDQALISAGISNYNLLKVSSILPAECIYSDEIKVKQGSPLLVAYGTITTNVEGEIIASAVAIGIPENCKNVGVIMECAGKYDAKSAEKIVRQMAIEAMENHGIPCKEVICSSAECTGVKGKCVSVISAVSMW